MTDNTRTLRQEAPLMCLLLGVVKAGGDLTAAVNLVAYLEAKGGRCAPWTELDALTRSLERFEGRGDPEAALEASYQLIDHASARGWTIGEAPPP